MYWNDTAFAEEINGTGLTLTWDVLKFGKPRNRKGVIEININMRCIEINYLSNYRQMLIRLTLTWDVLKWRQENWNLRRYRININMRCIEMQM